MSTLAIVAFLLVVAWLVDLRLHPYAPCRACGKSGRNAGSRRGAFGRCGTCGGKGERRRFGAGWVGR